jgi:hypothetical protein
MKEGYPPVNIKFTDRDSYYDCFKDYHETNAHSKMTKLVLGYAMDELKRYIDITEQSDKLLNGNPDNICGENKNRE